MCTNLWSFNAMSYIWHINCPLIHVLSAPVKHLIIFQSIPQILTSRYTKKVNFHLDLLIRCLFLILSVFFAHHNRSFSGFKDLMNQVFSVIGKIFKPEWSSPSQYVCKCMVLAACFLSVQRTRPLIWRSRAQRRASGFTPSSATTTTSCTSPGITSKNMWLCLKGRFG